MKTIEDLYKNEQLMSGSIIDLSTIVNRRKDSSIRIASDGFHMITPLTEKREQIRRQAETEQREYEAHLERTRLRDIHEVHRLGKSEIIRRRESISTVFSSKVEAD